MSRPGPGGRRRKARTTARQSALRGLVAVELGKSARLRDVVDVEGLEPRDRDFAWELAQGTERLHLMLDHVLTQFVTKRLPKVAVVRSVLRLGAYQLLMLSRVPARAAVNETVGLLRDGRGFPNAVLRRIAERIHSRPADPGAPRRELALPDGPDGSRCLAFDGDAFPEPDSPEFLAARYGLPEFLVRRWVEAHGFDAATSVCLASSTAPSVFLCATGRAPDPEEFVARLAAEDPTAYAAAREVDARPGERVLDLCAAPGTKTMVLAEGVGPEGTVFAWDVSRWKLDLVRENAERLGLTDRIEYPATSVLDEPVDRALADVPCSNVGVLARRVEVRRRITEDGIRELTKVQGDCLQRAVAACRPGGAVVYSTCSIEPEENRGVVDEVIRNAGESCEFVSDRLTLPDPAGGDGGYFAVLRRKD
jgi:16S rRNA (cytosine967-C5)-methyltransferase